MGQQEDIKFPLEFTRCPNCDSDRRVASVVLKQEISKGKMPENSRAWITRLASAIGQPKIIGARVPVVQVFLDVCADCGTVYCIHAVLGEVAQAANPPKPNPGDRFSPS